MCNHARNFAHVPRIGFLRAAVPVEIKSSKLNNTQVKDVSTVAVAATNATTEQTEDKNDANGDNKTDADDVSTDVTAGSDAGPGAGDVAAPASDTDASDAGLHCQMCTGRCIVSVV